MKYSPDIYECHTCQMRMVHGTGMSECLMEVIRSQSESEYGDTLYCEHPEAKQFVRFVNSRASIIDERTSNRVQLFLNSEDDMQIQTMPMTSDNSCCINVERDSQSCRRRMLAGTKLIECQMGLTFCKWTRPYGYSKFLCNHPSAKLFVSSNDDQRHFNTCL